MKLEEIAENHGLTPEGVDYALTQYQIVICEITHGMMSKLSYDAKDIIRMAQERWYDTCDLKEPVKPNREVNENGQILSCGNCGAWLIVQKQKYCHECQRAVKWDA